jgi:asparagine synthase (glutamine-hydrolysing)
MIGPSLVGWLGQPPEQAARLARWAEDLGAQPLLRDDALGLWLRPGGAARPLRWAGLAGAYVGRLYGVEDGASPRTIAEAQSGGRLQGLDGRFCAVLWDGGRHRLSLYRDPSSALPLYYRAAGPGAVFADDLDALAASPGSRGALDPDALHEYLRFLDIASPSTVYAGIRSPEPGVELVLAPGAEPRSVPGPAPRSAPARAPDTGDLGRAADRVEQLFDAAVARRLPPQGPVVAFLSGGVDSALIAASCARLAPGRTVAFTVGFEEHGFDETPAAAAIAAHLGLPHRVLRLPLAAYRPAFDELAPWPRWPWTGPGPRPAWGPCRVATPGWRRGSPLPCPGGCAGPRRERCGTWVPSPAMPRCWSSTTPRSS